MFSRIRIAYDYPDDVFEDVSRSAPCEICDRPDWCWRSQRAHFCRRVAGGEEHFDKHRIPFWIYRKDNHTASPADAPRAPHVEKSFELAPVQVRHAVYTDLLAELHLTADDRQHLRDRGLTDSTIYRCGYGSMPHQRTPGAFAKYRRDEVLSRTLRKHGSETLARVPGFPAGKFGLFLAGAKGILIPSRNARGQIQGIVIRVTEQVEGGKYRLLSSVSKKLRGGPSPGLLAHVPLWEGATDTVILTEGVLKADVATALMGILVIGCPGLAWGAALQALADLRVRHVMLAFDADAANNKVVGDAQRAAAVHLWRQGLRVSFLTWLAEHKGIDDAAAAGLRIGDGINQIQVEHRNSHDKPDFRAVWSTEPVTSSAFAQADRCKNLFSLRRGGDRPFRLVKSLCGDWDCGLCGPFRARQRLEHVQGLLQFYKGPLYMGQTSGDALSQKHINEAVVSLNAEYIRVRRVGTLCDEFLIPGVVYYIATQDLGSGWSCGDNAEAFVYFRDTMLSLPGVSRNNFSDNWRPAPKDPSPDPDFIAMGSKERMIGAGTRACSEVAKKHRLILKPTEAIPDPNDVTLQTDLGFFGKKFARDSALQFSANELNEDLWFQGRGVQENG